MGHATVFRMRHMGAHSHLQRDVCASRAARVAPGRGGTELCGAALVDASNSAKAAPATQTLRRQAGVRFTLHLLPALGRWHAHDVVIPWPGFSPTLTPRLHACFPALQLLSSPSPQQRLPVRRHSMHTAHMRTCTRQCWALIQGTGMQPTACSCLELSESGGSGHSGYPLKCLTVWRVLLDGSCLSSCCAGEGWEGLNTSCRT